jgi:uncharacterized OB-fold protein
MAPNTPPKAFSKDEPGHLLTQTPKARAASRPKLIVQTFYEGLAKGKLMGLKCTECSTVSFPPKGTCNTCGSFELGWIELSGRGKVNVYSVLNYPGGEFQAVAPYAFGLIKMKEGPVYYAMVKGVNLDDPWTGNQVLPSDVTAKVEKVGTKTIVVFHTIKTR